MTNRVVAIRSGALSATIAILVAAAPARAWPADEVVAAPSTGRTEVIIFTPAVPNAPQQQGYCWTPSIALSRAGAWRCTIGNAIEDPCFTTPDVSDAVICGANPATSDAGFLTRLTKPLPATTAVALPKPSPASSAWIVELAIGQGQVPNPYALPPPKTYCSAMMGTLPMVDGLAVPFSCWEAHVESKPKLGDTQIGLLGDFNPGRVWTVTEIMFTANPKTGPNQPPFKLTGRRVIALEKVWQ
jgi:hypothetical protein